MRPIPIVFLTRRDSIRTVAAAGERRIFAVEGVSFGYENDSYGRTFLITAGFFNFIAVPGLCLLLFIHRCKDLQERISTL